MLWEKDMDIGQTFLKILIEQAAKTTFEFVPRKFSELFGTKTPKEIIRRLQKDCFYQENFIKSLLFLQDWSAKFGRTEFSERSFSNRSNVVCESAYGTTRQWEKRTAF